MNNHAETWIDAYLDGALTAGQLRQADAHLAGCPACRALLSERKALSALLQDVPAARESKSDRQFAAEIGLRLPRRQESPGRAKQTALRAAWVLAPIALLLGWVFVQTVAFLSVIVEALPDARLGLLRGAGSGLPALTEPFSGLLAGLNLFNSPEWSALTYLVILSAIAILYASWLAAWWASSNHSAKRTLSTDNKN